ncbi:hypothetical protein GWK47_007851 [Chionoecetes opilio]|uniref:Uncharacterized protein n=1 Tax=Chionoecetes opilio TaxID=41210 RepID=A0A8J5CRG0_CHIOP|nr:hypothetical protein GWK47_007851 [Chionoecetes opilio]
MFHILETQPTKVRWCWLARERGTSTASPLVSAVLVLRVAILGGCRNPARCGTPCTCALWNTTSAATSLRCSSESRGLTGSNWAGGSGGSAASTSRRARHWMLSSLLVCEAAHDIQERAAYSNLKAPYLGLPAPACGGRRKRKYSHSVSRDCWQLPRNHLLDVPQDGPKHDPGGGGDPSTADSGPRPLTDGRVLPCGFPRAAGGPLDAFFGLGFFEKAPFHTLSKAPAM